MAENNSGNRNKIILLSIGAAGLVGAVAVGGIILNKSSSAPDGERIQDEAAYEKRDLVSTGDEMVSEDQSEETSAMNSELESYIMNDELRFVYDPKGVIEEETIPMDDYGYPAIQAESVTWSITTPYGSDGNREMDHLFSVFSFDNSDMAFSYVFDAEEDMHYSAIENHFTLVDSSGDVYIDDDHFVNNIICREEYAYEGYKSVSNNKSECYCEREIGYILSTDHHGYFVKLQLKYHSSSDGRTFSNNDYGIRLDSPLEDVYLKPFFESLEYLSGYSDVNESEISLSCFDDVFETMHFMNKYDLLLWRDDLIQKYGTPYEEDENSITYHIDDEYGGYYVRVHFIESTGQLTFSQYKTDYVSGGRTLGFESGSGKDGGLSRFACYADEFNISDADSIREYAETVPGSDLTTRVYPYDYLADYYNLNSYNDFKERFGVGNLDKVFYFPNTGEGGITVRWVFPEIGATFTAQFSTSTGELYMNSHYLYQGYIGNDGEVMAALASNKEGNSKMDDYPDADEGKDKNETKNKTGTNRGNDYILPDSSKKLLTISDLRGLSAEECRLARNEIYARHGRRFSDEELQSYFDSKDWYDGTIDPDDFKESELTDIETANRDLIVEYEKKSGYR